MLKTIEDWLEIHEDIEEKNLLWALFYLGPKKIKRVICEDLFSNLSPHNELIKELKNLNIILINANYLILDNDFYEQLKILFNKNGLQEKLLVNILKNLISHFNEEDYKEYIKHVITYTTAELFDDACNYVATSKNFLNKVTELTLNNTALAELKVWKAYHIAYLLNICYCNMKDKYSLRSLNI